MNASIGKLAVLAGLTCMSVAVAQPAGSAAMESSCATKTSRADCPSSIGGSITTTAPAPAMRREKVAPDAPAGQLPQAGLRRTRADSVIPVDRNPATAGLPAQVPPLPYRYVGRVESSWQSLVLLMRMRDERVFVASLGAIVEGTYRIDEFVADGVNLTYLPLNVMQRATAAGMSDSTHPIDLVLTVPAQITCGSLFQVVVGVSSAIAAQSAQLNVSYDVDVLQYQATDAKSGPAPSVVSWTPGSLNLEFQVAKSDGAATPLIIEFLVIGDTPGATRIALTAAAKDGSGKVISSAPVERRMFMVLDSPQ